MTLPEAATDELDETPEFPLMFFITFGKVLPLSRDLLYKISEFPGVLSVHTTCTLFPETAMDGLVDDPVFPLRFFMIFGNEFPSSVDLLYKISAFPGVKSLQTT